MISNPGARSRSRSRVNIKAVTRAATRGAASVIQQAFKNPVRTAVASSGIGASAAYGAYRSYSQGARPQSRSRSLSLASSRSTKAYLKEQHAGVKSGGKNKLKGHKKESLKTRVRKLEKIHAMNTYRNLTNFGQMSSNSNACATYYFPIGYNGVASSPIYTDIFDIVHQQNFKVNTAAGSSAIVVDPTLVMDQGLFRVEVIRFYQTHIFRNNYTQPINISFYWYLAKGDNALASPVSIFNTDMANAGVSGSASADLNLSITMSPQVRREFRLLKKEKATLATGEQISCSVEVPKSKILDLQANTAVNSGIVKNWTTYLVVRIYGSITHDTNTHNNAAITPSALDHVAWTVCKYRQVDSVSSSLTTDSVTLSTVTNANSVLYDPDLPGTSLVPGV